MPIQNSEDKKLDFTVSFLQIRALHLSVSLAFAPTSNRVNMLPIGQFPMATFSHGKCPSQCVPKDETQPPRALGQHCLIAGGGLAYSAKHLAIHLLNGRNQLKTGSRSQFQCSGQLQYFFEP
jgi:hypothetical protein